MPRISPLNDFSCIHNRYSESGKKRTKGSTYMRDAFWNDDFGIINNDNNDSCLAKMWNSVISHLRSKIKSDESMFSSYEEYGVALKYAPKENLSLLKNHAEFKRLFENKKLSPVFVKTCLSMEKEKLELILAFLETKSHKHFMDKSLENNDDMTLSSLNFLGLRNKDISEFKNMLKNANNPYLLRMVENDETDYDTYLRFVRADNLNGLFEFLSDEKIKKLHNNGHLPKDLLKMFAAFSFDEPQLFLKLIDNENILNAIKEKKLSTSRIFEILSLPKSLFPVLNLDDLDYQYRKVAERPELYLSGQYNSTPEMLDIVHDFFDNNFISLLVLSSLYDKNTMNNFLRMRFDKVEKYICDFDALSNEYMALFPKLVKAKNANGQPFTSSDKIDFINLLTAYYNFDSKKVPRNLTNSLKSEKINVQKLKKELFFKLLDKFGISRNDMLPLNDDKLSDWDLQFVHLLGLNSEAFSDIFKIAIKNDFLSHILSKNNPVGKLNAKTVAAFEKHGLDFLRWLRPSDKNNVHLVVKNSEDSFIEQIIRQLYEDLSFLRENDSARDFIDRHFQNCIDDFGNFILPDELYTNKTKLFNFIKNLTVQLQSLRKRANEKLETSPDNAAALSTAAIFKGFERKMLALQKAQFVNDNSSLDCTIKMWDRYPQRDLFQGNYSSCCMAIGESNEEAILNYLNSAAFNMIEFVDNKTGKTFGNALCYFISTHDDKKVLVLDNIEINNSFQINDGAKEKLRDAILQYAKNVAKEVTGVKNPQVYLGLSNNDIDVSDLEHVIDNIGVIGAYTDKDTYLDVFHGWTSEYFGRCELLKLV